MHRRHAVSHAPTTLTHFVKAANGMNTVTPLQT
jgi:hypothetical protein